MPFDIYAEKSVEFDYFTCGDKVFGSRGGLDFDGGLFHYGISHLRCYGTFPNQVVEFLFLSGAFDGVVADICWADGFVGLLCAFRRSVVVSHFKVFGANLRFNLFGDGADSK